MKLATWEIDKIMDFEKAVNVVNIQVKTYTAVLVELL